MTSAEFEKQWREELETRYGWPPRMVTDFFSFLRKWSRGHAYDSQSFASMNDLVESSKVMWEKFPEWNSTVYRK